MKEAIISAVRELFDIESKPLITHTEPQFGDYASNIAMQLAKMLGKNPREIAEQLAEKLRSNDLFTEVTVAGPGFLNVRVVDSFFVEKVAESPSLNRRNQKIVIETNNPNPFKAMHIGHAFNAILADTIANLLELSGGEVHRVSYHGDVGAHVGKSMYSLLRYVDGTISKLAEISDTQRNSFMSRMYAEGAKAYKESDEAREEINRLAQQSFALDDELYRQVYTTCAAWSFEQIDQIVARLGNKPIEKRYLESQADACGVDIVQTHVPDVFQKNDGALVFSGSQYGSFDNVFVSSTGRGLYAARDLGLMQLKNDDYHAQKSYIVTAEEQRDYFKGVIAAAELCMLDLKGVTTNISTGTVKLTTGKMSSRDGDVVEIDWLFEQIANALRARGGEASDDLVAGALRYQFLKVKIGSDVIFDVSEAVSLRGNTGSYLQYAHARACSVLDKSDVHPSNLNGEELTADERKLLVKVSEYNDIVTRAIEELLPHHICTYLYELAQEFNRFYEKNRVVGDSRESQRRSLVEYYQQTLARGLAVLGIRAPHKM